MLPGFNYAPGFTNWKVFNSEVVEYENYEQVPDALKSTQIHQGMFADEEFNKKNHLDYCIRMLPHHNNDGGFFAALLKKVKPLPWELEYRTVKIKEICIIFSVCKDFFGQLSCSTHFLCEFFDDLWKPQFKNNTYFIFGVIWIR